MNIILAVYLVFAYTVVIKIVKQLKSQQDQHDEVGGIHFGSSYLQKQSFVKTETVFLNARSIIITHLKHENVLIVHLIPAFHILIVIDLSK